MVSSKKLEKKCDLCGKEESSLVKDLKVSLFDFIRKSNPNWIENNGMCFDCYKYYREGLRK